MSGSDEIKGLSPYAKKQKRPFQYSPEYQAWRSTGDSSAHDFKVMNEVRKDNMKGGRNDRSKRRYP